MKSIGKVTLEFFQSENGEIVGNEKVEGGIPVNTLIMSLETLKTKFILDYLTKLAMAQQQQQAKNIILPSGPLPKRQ